MLEACRIWWIKQLLLASRAFQLTRNHSGLNDCNCIGKTYFLDSIHPHEREGDPPANRDATADIAVPGPAGSYGNLILVSEPFVAAIVGQCLWIVSYGIVAQQTSQFGCNSHLVVSFAAAAL